MEKKHSRGHSKDKAFDWEKWRNILLISLTVILIINVSIIFFMQNKIKDMQKAAEEALRPANIELIAIKDKNCSECVNIDQLTTLIKENNVKIIKEIELNINDKEAKELITKYEITKIPSLIVTGEIGKLTGLAERMERKQDGYVLTQVPAPYIDIQSGKVKGIVEAALIYKKDCEKCTNLSLLLQQLKMGGIYLLEEKSYEFSSKDAKEVINKYNITRIPFVVFSSDLGDYEQVRQNWQAVGTVEKDGKYVFREVPVPYYDAVKNENIGLVGIVFITDKNCTKCYNVTVHKQILAGMGIVLGYESSYDISTDDGRELIERYNITKVPTMYMSNDLEAYPQLTEVWSQIGTKDIKAGNESVYIFRAVEIMGIYHDLKTGQVVEPVQGQST